MTQTIKLYDIYHADLFSRAKAAQLADYISPDADIVVLDFGGITFMSRSFTDELYNIVIAYPHKTFTYTGRNDDIRVMMEKVVDAFVQKHSDPEKVRRPETIEEYEECLKQFFASKKKGSQYNS